MNVTDLFRGKPVYVEEGPAKCSSANKYLILHRDESTTDYGRIVQIVKVIVCIELIILIGWLGCVSFSYYNTDRNTGCGVSAIGCKGSEIIYIDVEVENSRWSRSVEGTDDGEKCERNMNATRRGLERLAAQFVTMEPSDPTVLQLRRNFTELTMSATLRMTVLPLIIEGIFGQFTNNKTTTNITFLTTVPNDLWQPLMEKLSEQFVNSTDSQNRQWLEARGPPTAEMTSEFRTIVESFYIAALNCDRLVVESLLESLMPFRKLITVNKKAIRSKRDSEPVNQLTINCRDAEAQLLEERRERLEALVADVASDHFIVGYTRLLMSSIESALNATSPSEVTVDDMWLRNDRWLIPWKRFMSDASLQLKKEFYELVGDNDLEMRYNYNNSLAWQGFNFRKAWRNFTDGLRSLTETGPEAVLNLTIIYGNSFSLHYVEAKREDSSIDSERPAFGTFTYLDAEPEKRGVRRMRNILNGFVRLYFRVINRLGACEPAAVETPTPKRFFIPNLLPKPLPPMRWFRKKQLARLEEHRARLKAFVVENTTSKLQHDELNFLEPAGQH